MTSNNNIIQQIIKYGIILGISLNLISCSSFTAETNGWQKLPAILNEIKAPTFNNKEFDITDYGAIGNGNFDCTEAFRKAINACSEAGGGKVVIPNGTYLTGAIHLKSNVNLYVSKSAVVLFMKDVKRFLPVVFTRFEGIECYNYSPFIYAYEQENIAVTGSGTIDGNAGTDNWWIWKGRSEYGWQSGMVNGNDHTELLYKMPEQNIPVEERVFGDGYYLRTNFIQFYKCKNILIDSVTIKRSPMWVVHPVLSENVTIQNIRVISHGPNNDGCNPESSRNVLIKNCYFDTGDDCIAIKSGRNADGRRINVPSENIVVQNCTMKDGHGGVVIGSEVSGNIRNIYIEDCLMDSPNLDRALRIKTNSMRGGIVENIYMRNCIIGEVSDAVIKVNFLYGEGDAGSFTPVVRNIFVTNIRSKKSKYAIHLQGYERSPIENLIITDSVFEDALEGSVLNHYNNLKMKNVIINGAFP
ncbi:MAG: glycoside hydrolase family 28 protein [Calditrichaceae bacterium]|nr:glycoside hydrolase family 28 protein [Calditrichaceae bacterium]MBN2710369.1 glycoside hydrolase family 28 protein [Calditrichaceae bacterium]RQV95118.1 MAG: glycoside hydrolase family 28 protein [Calditrichota bacterium]